MDSVQRDLSRRKEQFQLYSKLCIVMAYVFLGISVMFVLTGLDPSLNILMGVLFLLYSDAYTDRVVICGILQFLEAQHDRKPDMDHGVE